MGNEKIRRQHGLWDSPISPLSLARGIIFTDIAWDQDGSLVWREGRSNRSVLVIQREQGHAARDFSSDLSVRASVGYGGGDFAVSRGDLFFAEEETGRLYRQSLVYGQPKVITPAFGRFASPSLSPDGDWLLFVHNYEGRDSLGIVDAAGQYWPAKLAWDEDFYMHPVWHPNGKHLAWITWNHPNMPWDGTYLRTGRLMIIEKGLPVIEHVETVAGDERTSIFQPQYSPDGKYLAFVSDKSGWWQIWLHDLESGDQRQLTSGQADHGLPAWVQGLRTYDFSPDGKTIFYLRNQEGFASLWNVDVATGEHRKVQVDSDYTWMEQISIAPSLNARGSIKIGLLASGGRTPPRLITITIPSESQSGEEIIPDLVVRARASAEDLAPEVCSTPENLTWNGMDHGKVHGIFYPPHNQTFVYPGVPPLIVMIHGGPTSQRRTAYNPQAQFFTSRGYAVLDVNYRGSTGYGRSYWEALKGNWGVFDVQDAVSGAQFFADQGRVDKNRLVIMGGSAGGFTVLQALVEFPGFFKAGICLYGIANQFTLVAETHKFEQHYSDTLLGPLPQAAAIYRERSPIFHADRIQDPIIIFQGEDDKVVPRSLSDLIVASLHSRNVPHEYHLYPGEGHGFRKTETIEHFYTSIDKFLKQYVIFS